MPALQQTYGTSRLRLGTRDGTWIIQDDAVPHHAKQAAAAATMLLCGLAGQCLVRGQDCIARSGRLC